MSKQIYICSFFYLVGGRPLKIGVGVSGRTHIFCETEMVFIEDKLDNTFLLIKDMM